jgi:HK97 family phage major capsid protein
VSEIYDRALDREMARTLERARDIQSMRENAGREFRGYSIARAISEMATENRRGYLEGEISQDLERVQPAKHGGLLIPPEVLVRAATVGGAAGALVETINLQTVDAIRPAMIAGNLGATMIQAPHGAAINIPRQTAAGSAQWLPLETSVVSETDQGFGQLSLSPHTVGAYTEFSRLLGLQAGPSPADFVITRDLCATVGRALDLAVFFGPGVGGAPKGLVSTPGINTFSGTAASVTSIIGAAVSLGDALNSSAGVATTKAVAGLLRERQEFSGSTKTLWQGSLIAGTCCDFPARSSSQLTAGSFFIGSFNYVNVAIWGTLEVVSNPYGDQASGAGNFQKGIIGVRAFLSCDVGVTFPSSFNFASAIT